MARSVAVDNLSLFIPKKKLEIQKTKNGKVVKLYAWSGGGLHGEPSGVRCAK